MTKVPITRKPVHWFAEQTMDLFLYDRTSVMNELNDSLFKKQMDQSTGVLY